MIPPLEADWLPFAREMPAGAVFQRDRRWEQTEKSHRPSEHQTWLKTPDPPHHTACAVMEDSWAVVLSQFFSPFWAQTWVLLCSCSLSMMAPPPFLPFLRAPVASLDDTWVQTQSEGQVPVCAETQGQLWKEGVWPARRK